MATSVCGNAQVNYDAAKCSFKCTTIGEGTHYWNVTCQGGIVVSGTGRGVGQPKGPSSSIVVAGNLEQLAVALGKDWKRSVTVPTGLRGKVIRQRSLKGSPEEIATALGLTLGPKKKRIA
jgi:hypothetical protein